MPRQDLFRLSGVSDGVFRPPPHKPTPAAGPSYLSYLSMATVFQLWDVVAKQLDTAKALRAASRAIPLAKLGEFGFMCITAPTLEDALRKICWAFSLLTDSGRWHFLLEGARCTLVWDRIPQSSGQCFSNEALLAQFYDNITGFCGTPLPVLEVQLVHRPFCPRPALGALFGAPVRYDAPRTGFSIPRDFLRHPPVNANRDLFEYFVDASQRLLRERSARGTLLCRVQQAIAEGLSDGRLSETYVARRMGVSPRTLQRQLASIGTSFKRERDDLLKDRARGLVTMTRRPLAEVADELGFAEPTAFSRAFRRWFGTSPNAMRRPAYAQTG